MDSTAGRCKAYHRFKKRRQKTTKKQRQKTTKQNDKNNDKNRSKQTQRIKTDDTNSYFLCAPPIKLTYIRAHRIASAPRCAGPGRGGAHLIILL